MKSLLSIVALCSFSFTFASGQDVPNCSLFRYMFGAPKVSLENLKSAVESRDYCKARAILSANDDMIVSVARQYILSRVFSHGFNFKSLDDNKAVDSGIAESISASTAVLSQDKILSCKVCLANNPNSALGVMSPSSLLRRRLIGTASVQQVSNLLEGDSPDAVSVVTPFSVRDSASWQAGKSIGYKFASDKSFSKEEDRCNSMIEFFEKAGYSPRLIMAPVGSGVVPSNISGGASSGFGEYARSFGKKTGCNIDRYFFDKMRKEALDNKAEAAKSASWQAGKSIGYKFASDGSFSKEEDRCKAMIEFFEKAGYYPPKLIMAPVSSSNIIGGASSGFGEYTRSFGKKTGCNIDRYFFDKMRKEALDKAEAAKSAESK